MGWKSSSLVARAGEQVHASSAISRALSRLMIEVLPAGDFQLGPGAGGPAHHLGDGQDPGLAPAHGPGERVQNSSQV